MLPVSLSAGPARIAALLGLVVATLVAGLPAVSASSAGPDGRGTSSTSDRVAAERPAQRRSDAETITFDDYGTGTSITDEYLDHGVVFTSSVFIASDNANPTTPVLSGSPRFYGSISGRFTTPGTTTAATVTGFTLDVGYINERNSVVVRYFDSAGKQLGAYPAQAYGINTIAVDYAGIASFTVEAISEEPSGFAVDNLSIRRGAEGITPRRMVSFGDSYSSGEGLIGDKGLRYDCATDLRRSTYREDTTVPYQTLFFASDCDTRTMTNKRPDDFTRRKATPYENMCHRHARAYPNAIRAKLGISGANSLFVACSGAETEDIRWRPQYGVPGSPVNIAGGRSQLVTANTWSDRGDPDFVTIGIGGNDAGFVSIITKCMTTACSEDEEWKEDTLNTIEGKVYYEVVDTLEDVRSSFGDATVALFGYPSVIGDPAKDCGGFKAWGGAVKIEESERRWVKDVLFPRLNQTLREAAAAAGVTFIDITSVTQGHEICTAKPWVNGLLGGAINSDNESFHPNELAHDAIARWFIRHYTNDGQLLFFNPTRQPPIDSGIEVTMQQGQVDVQSIQGGAERACLQGCPLTIQGDGYTPGAQLELTVTPLVRPASRLARQAAVTPLPSVEADDDGAFAANVTLPKSLAPGHYVLNVDGEDWDGLPQQGMQLFQVFGKDPGPLTKPVVRATLKPKLTRRGVVVQCATSAPRVRCGTTVVIRAGKKVIARADATRVTSRRGTVTLVAKLTTAERRSVAQALRQHRVVRARATVTVRTALFTSTDRDSARIKARRS